MHKAHYYIKMKLYDYQKEAVDKLRNGSILCGGVGSGKSITAIAYYVKKHSDRDVYIITTAKKRDSLEWERDCAHFCLSRDYTCSYNRAKVTVDSWNNIKKYKDIKRAFFIFDEQRLVGSGVWVKSFLKIVKRNSWILLTATPGDTWSDYIPVFIANQFYANRTEFLREHAVYNRFTKYPKVENYIGTKKLNKFREAVLVTMNYSKPTIDIHKTIICDFDLLQYKKIMKERWNIYKDQPIKTISEVCYLLRRVVNSDESRLDAVKEVLRRHPRVIIFYNFNYELDILTDLTASLGIDTAEWNGHHHHEIPTSLKWVYLVQYTAGAEGWNCITTDTILFFSQNYSYKIMVQSAGRIDRLNSPFQELYYYHLTSQSTIDLAIERAIKAKKNFNIVKFVK